MLIAHMAYWFREKVGDFQDYQQTTGLDVHCIFSNPRFVDLAKGAYRLSPDSPTPRLRTDVAPVVAESLWN